MNYLSVVLRPKIVWDVDSTCLFRQHLQVIKVLQTPDIEDCIDLYQIMY